MSSVRSRNSVITAAALASSLVCTPAVMGQAPAAGQETPAASTTSSFSRYNTRVGDREIVIEIRDGQITTATIDGQPIPPENIRRLDNGTLHIDQPGDAADYWINTGSGGGTTAVSGRAGNMARSQIVVVGPHGEPMTLDIPDWTAQAEAERELAQRAFTFRKADPASDQPPPKVMIGVQMSRPSPELAGHLGIKPDEATLIAGVYPDLPAAKAGLERYDVIVGVDGQESAGGEAVREALADAEPGDTLRLTVLHRGERKDVEIILAPWDDEALSVATSGAIAEEESLREAMRLAEIYRQGAGAWAGENGAATFTLPAIQGRAAALELDRDSRAMAERLAEVEQQLQRLEELLGRLVEQEESVPGEAPRSAPVPAPPGPPALPHDDFSRAEQRA